MFQTVQKNNLTILQSDIFPVGVHHGFSTRSGGVSPAPWDSLNLGVSRGDDLSRVQENYRRFCAVLDVDMHKCVLSKQIHEDKVRLVTKDDWGKGLWRDRDYTSVDAMVTDTPDTPLVVFSADCGVILLYDPVKRVIGAAHAGWRGTAMGIVAKAVHTMVSQFGCEASDICAAIGPSIGSCCFETDDDVPAALRQALGSAVEPYMVWNGRKWHIDLKSINALWLRREGVAHIDICDLCTMCHPELFWSHRKMGQERGVQVAMLSLEEKL